MFSVGAPLGWSMQFTECMVGGHEALHPSRFCTDSFPSTMATAGLTTEEQLFDTRQFFNVFIHKGLY